VRQSMRKASPSRHSPGKSGSISRLQPPIACDTALRSARLASSVIARSSLLYRQHFDEAVDQQPVAGMRIDGHGNQVRITASAAIIRASGSSPTRCRAATMWNRCAGDISLQ